MSDKLPVVTGKALLRALKKAGWMVHHVRGSHHQLMHEQSKKKITVAIHAGKEIKRGMLSGILKEIGMDGEDLRRLL